MLGSNGPRSLTARSSPLKNEAWGLPTLQETIIYLTIREKEIIFTNIAMGNPPFMVSSIFHGMFIGYIRFSSHPGGINPWLATDQLRVQLRSFQLPEELFCLLGAPGGGQGREGGQVSGTPKMDGEFIMEKNLFFTWDDLGEKPTIFGNIHY